MSVIYLNTLDAQEDKEFFLAALAERLYAWMLASPSVTPQALFYVDEVAPFLPPVRKPACKDALQLLLKQARKYGVGCLLATQNPGDLDYKALAQVSTWALGRVTTRQDLAKLAPALRPSVGEVQRAFGARFTARATSAALVFVPLWTLVLRAEGGRGFRRITIDGVVGKLLAWP